MLCVDSDLIIDLLRGEEAATRFFQANEGLVTTTISCYEVLMGPRKGTKRFEAAVALLRSLKLFGFDWSSMMKAAEVSQTLISQGKHIGDFDEMIAGTCLANDLTLVTRNKKHFSKVKGLKVKSW